MKKKTRTKKKTTTTTTTKKKQNSNCTHLDLCRGARSSQSDTVGGSAAAAAAASSSLFSCNQHVTLFCVCVCVYCCSISEIAACCFLLCVVGYPLCSSISEQSRVLYLQISSPLSCLVLIE